MTRSPIKSGQHTHRSRASTRRRDRLDQPEPERDELAALRDWLAEQDWPDTLEGLQQIDPKRYLQQTGNFDLSMAERLRHLAIHLEWDAGSAAQQAAGWFALRAIYDAALRFGQQEE